VALVWRWTGDNRFRDELYDFSKRTLRYLIRGLYDLGDMARSKGDRRTAAWAESRARALQRDFEETWWMPAERQYADSIDTPPVGGMNDQQQDRHWIGVTPRRPP
jgi:hypothetical protein